MQLVRQIVKTLSKLFNVRTPEWPRLLLLYLMNFIFIASLTWGELILYAAFLQHIGFEALRVFFIAKAIISVLAVAVYSAFADRVANDKLLIGIFLIGAVPIVTGLFLLEQGFVTIAYPLLYLTVFVPFYDVQAAHWYTYVNGFYDTRSAKRIIPVLATSVSAASIFAGFSMPLLNNLFAPTSIIIIWTGSLVIVALLTWLMPYLLGDKKARLERAVDSLPSFAETKEKEQPASFFENIRDGYRYVLQSKFLRWMTLSALLLALLQTFVEYQTGRIFEQELQTTENISSFTGTLVSVSNIVILLFQSLLLGRIMGRIGLANANLIFPVGTLTISGSLIFFQNLPAAALAYLNRGEFAAMGYSINSLLYNAVPLRIKGRARAFITGIVIPLGLLGGGILLLIPLVDTAWFVPVLIGLCATGYVASELVVRREYGQALLKMLEQEDFSSLLSERVSRLSVTDPATLNALRKRLEESNNYEFTIFMAELISQVGGQAAVPLLAEAAKQSPDGRVRAGLIDVLVAADIQGSQARQFYTGFLNDPDRRVRQSAIAGLEQLVGPDDEQFLTPALKMLEDPDIEVRAQILFILANSTDFYAYPLAVHALNHLLAEQDPAQRARGVQILGQIIQARTSRNLDNVSRPIFTLARHLADPEDQVRLQAALAVEAISKNKVSDQASELILQQMSGLANDPVERIRQATLVVYGRLGKAEAYPILVEALKDASSQVRTVAVDTMVEAGRAIIPVIHPRLNAPDPQLRKMVTVILSRINQEEYGPLLKSYITHNLLEVYRNYNRLGALAPLATYPTVTVLNGALHEQNQQRLNEIFYLLTAIHDRRSIKLISDALRSSDGNTRANGIEALETLTSPQTATLIGQLFDPDLSSAKILSLGQELWEMGPLSTIEVVRQLIQDQDHVWLRAITTLALGELALDASDQEEPDLSAPAKKRSRPGRSGGMGLFDLLGGDQPDKDSSERNNKRAGRRVNPLALFADTDETPAPTNNNQLVETTPPSPIPLTRSQIDELLQVSFKDPMLEIRLAARAANRIMQGKSVTTHLSQEEATLLSAVEKIIFLKEVPFFQGMTIDQLTVLANVCEEQIFEEDTRIYNEGDPGGTLYVVVSGRVSLEQERRKGSFARLATFEAHSYFGEMNLFDNSPRSSSAIALQDTLTLKISREPLIALARQYPDLSLELINVLSQRLRETNDRVAELTKTRPRELHKLFDKFD
jgi:HEAT repeat protein